MKHSGALGRQVVLSNESAEKVMLTPTAVDAVFAAHRPMFARPIVQADRNCPDRPRESGGAAPSGLPVPNSTLL